MKYCVDSFFIKDRKANLIGWIVPSQKDRATSFFVTNEKGEKTECEIYRSIRPDIGFLFFRDPSFPETSFYVRIPLENSGKAILHIVEKEGEEIRIEKKIPVGNFALRGLNLKKQALKVYSDFYHSVGFVVNKMTKRLDQKYRRWFSCKRASEEELQREREEVFENPIRFSILTPVYKTPKKFLTEMLESVQAQTYPYFELCIVNGSKDHEESSKVLEEYAKKDSRIILKTLDENLGIAGNSNETLKFATGDYVCLLDHDDLLEPNALYEYAKLLGRKPELDMIYSDEDKVTEKSTDYYYPNFKTDFNVDYLFACNYICHFFCVRRSLLQKIGGWREGYDGAQDYDLILRLIEESKSVHHIPKILYHWRSYAASTAKNHKNKSYAGDAGQKAIQDHYRRMGYEGRVEALEIGGLYRTVYEKKENEPLVSVIIPNKDHMDDLIKCVHSLLRVNTYENIEILIAENNSTEEKTFACYEELKKEDPRIQVLVWKDEFNYSAINNFAVREAKGELILLLNNDIEVLSPNFLRQMVGRISRPEVGAVGAKLLYPDHTVQHGGVLVGAGGLAVHMFTGKAEEDPGYFGRAIISIDVSCVTAACLLTKKSVYEEVGGLDEEFRVAYNDVDFCLKVREKGYLIVQEADAKLLHYESKSRGTENTPEKFLRFSGETMRLNAKWNLADWSFGETYADPYYNPNFSYSNLFTPDY